MRGARVEYTKLCGVEMKDVRHEISQTFPNLYGLSVEAGVSTSQFSVLIAADEACATSGEAVVWSQMESLTLMRLSDETVSELVQRSIREAVGYPIKKVIFYGGALPASILCFVQEYVNDVTKQHIDEDSHDEGEDRDEGDAGRGASDEEGT